MQGHRLGCPGAALPKGTAQSGPDHRPVSIWPVGFRDKSRGLTIEKSLSLGLLRRPESCYSLYQSDAQGIANEKKESFTVRREQKIMTENTVSRSRTTTNVRELCITAICIVLVYVFTSVVNIRLPIAAAGGLIHLGNVPLFVAAILFGKRTGMLAGGIGMGLFDLLSGWTAWAPFTLVIVGCMGFVVGLVTEKKKSFPFYILAIVLACAIKIGGYYVAEGIIYGNWIAPVASIPGNLIQIGVAAVITLIIIEPLRVAAEHTILRK
jgi:uncharacterized membrane protein